MSGPPLCTVADTNLADIPDSRLSRWQLIQKIQQHFGIQWSKDYISELQQRNKWTKPAEPLKENQLVLIKDENLPPLRWKLGRISELHPGKDSVARPTTVKTGTGTLRRGDFMITMSKSTPRMGEYVSDCITN
ncbi:uncharacterized protein LOC117182326 [Belonocnema kinseyi]|uniref:uncharacterized protein LOC117182326 n=1 Tax=Belonocnema kinseyi TaxID=2817044 RepID=UPI00143D8013|nr:uncharacterized protein LOC117182326 [Belonocnema kinseyi]